MKKILAFAGSTSSTSINKKLATFAAQNLEKTAFDVLDLRNFSIPVYSTDEEQNGFPEDVKKFTALLDNYDGFILSLAEHNGTYAAAFKNIFDWSSRIEVKVFRDKPVLLMATSPGAMGGQFVLSAAAQRFPRQGATEIITYSLPNFFDNFNEDTIKNEELLASLKLKVNQFEKAVNQ